MTQRNILQGIFTPALVLLALVIGLHRVQAQGLDRIRDRNGITTGKITKLSALSVTLSRNGVESKKPVEEIVSITFAGEPQALATARRHALAGRYDDALEKLDAIDRKKVQRTEIDQEIDFLSTVCKVRLALAGQETLDEARTQVTSFLSKHSRSYHVPEAIELLGNVLLASKDYDGALRQYGKLGKAPAPYFKARSSLLKGHTQQAAGNHEQAVTAFDEALEAAAGNTIAQSQVREARLRRAVSQSSLGKLESSLDTVHQIISEAASKEDTTLLAQAYNALGDCHLQAGENKAAVQAFLHVDLLFETAAEEHAKALFELSQLWDQIGKTNRARDAQQRLEENHPSSQWARRAEAKR